jgi:hypothetical protein
MFHMTTFAISPSKKSKGVDVPSLPMSVRVGDVTEALVAFVPLFAPSKKAARLVDDAQTPHAWCQTPVAPTVAVERASADVVQAATAFVSLIFSANRLFGLPPA